MATAVNTPNHEVVACDSSEYPTKLVFDTRTPRPHFIFVQKYKAPKASPEELKLSFKLAGSFLLKNTQYNQDAILSFHCGKWYQEYSKEWHAHLCVPYEAYEEAAKVAIQNVPNVGQWRSAHNIRDGLKSYGKKQHEKYNGYKEDTLLEIKSTTTQYSVPLSNFNKGEFSLVWTSPTPRIGIIWDSSKSDLSRLYDFMNNTRVEMEKQLTQCDISTANFGCHLCLFLRGQDGIELTPRDCQVFSLNNRWEKRSIVGYIHTEEMLYYKWLPNNLRTDWSKEFECAEHFVRT